MGEYDVYLFFKTGPVAADLFLPLIQCISFIGCIDLPLFIVVNEFTGTLAIFAPVFYSDFRASIGLVREALMV